MAPTGHVHVCSFNSEIPFVRQLLDKIGVLPELIRFKDYKSFADTFLADKLSDKVREMMESILNSLKNTFVQGVANERKLSLEDVIYALENGPISPADAISKNLVR